jgi:hypothetical protein
MVKMTISERDLLLQLIEQVQRETPLVYEGEVSPLKILKDYLERLLKSDDER